MTTEITATDPEVRRDAAQEAPTVRFIAAHEGFRPSSDLVEMLETEGYRVISFSSVEQMLLSGIDQSHAGCIVLGVQMLEASGLDLQALLTSQSDLPVILVTANTTAREVVRAMKQGAADLFCNPLDEGAFVTAVNKAIADHRAIVGSRERHTALALRRASLSPREREVFELMILGGSSKSICQQLGLAERTLKHHRSRVMEKMGVKSIVQLVLALEGSRL